MSNSYTLADAWAHWVSDKEFPIAFLGDSTFAGVNTSRWSEDSTKNYSEDSFTFRLEKLLKTNLNSKIPEIINAGFSGDTSLDCLEKLPNLISPGGPLYKAKMIGVGLGINDRILYQSVIDYRLGFKKNLEKIIQYLLANQFQPFLLTSQAIVAPGVHTQYQTEYPLRTSFHIAAVANQVKRELAKKYALELIDLTNATEKFLNYSDYEIQAIISDQLHFGDIGHQFVAEYLFSVLCPDVIQIEHNTWITYANQMISSDIPEDKLILAPSPVNKKFKCYVYDENSPTSNTLLFDAAIFNNSCQKINLSLYKNSNENTGAYLILNEEKIPLTQSVTTISNLDIGLFSLKIYSGKSEIKDFSGIKVSLN